ncbi:zf-C3HC4_3 domain-containing protein [Cephalotus follicularis]|uniref:Zf-C3HC4_3 domain-containing protein n=1 Tax=Cephalotus follicularis TaxID=3775 RepID=A0A1Q3BRF2_CEPFO|nr:zf-C3HC4_3 domain-containing protein [Cephalotus follicularis]
MAIAGLHKVSVLDSPFLRESQSQALRRQGEVEREGTQASSLLQMWRELEDDHVVSDVQEGSSQRLLPQQSDEMIADVSGEDVHDDRNNEQFGGLEDMSVGETEFGQWCPSQNGSQNGHEDSSNFNCERSLDLGAVERERVRQIFQEWMNSGMRGHSSHVSHVNNSSRAEWLGENEQERVRIIREYVQMNNQQTGACSESREDQSSEGGGQIERVLDGLVVDQNEGPRELNRRGIRRLCGRQALLDMLKKAERERQIELQLLSEHQAVSQFAHRNRIQSLLRGRFLRNDRIIENDRPTSMAANELGLLRQKHTVSGLREGFILKKDLSVCGQASGNQSNTSSNVDNNGNRDEQIQTNNSHGVINEFHEQYEHDNDESGNPGLLNGLTDLEGNSTENSCSLESSVRLEEWQEQASENEVREWQQSSVLELFERRESNGQGLEGHWPETTAIEFSHETLLDRAEQYIHMREAGEVFHEQSEESDDQSAISGLMHVTGNFECIIEDTSLQESAGQVEQWHEQVFEDEERDWQQARLELNEWRDNAGEDRDGNQQESASNQSSQELLDNEAREPSSLQEAPEVQREDGGFQEAVQNLLEQPSDHEDLPVGSINAIYFPHDDNVYGMEIRELLSRRSVSNLLRSGFRESLDQLIQSYAERQSHAAIDWELQENSPTVASADQDLEQQSGDQIEGQIDAIESPSVSLPSPVVPPASSLWDLDSHHDNWPPHDMHQRFGIEWDIISDMRIGMSRLQQRMNNMQRMLEACMDMQLELQRSIRQEVSAALNRSAGTPGLCDNSLPKDGSKWDYVRKGICCICCHRNIDSLLYRCGHMCTCSKCANELVQSGDKCPMCWAPVVEVIRAYCIL